MEPGIEPELVAKRIEKLRRNKEAAEIDLRAPIPPSADSGTEEDIGALLDRLPDLGQALRKAPGSSSARCFEAFCLQITYDKLARRIEMSATVSEAVAQAFQNARDLP